MNPAADEVKIATIGKDIEYIRKDIQDIKDSLKALPGMYLTQKEHTEFVVAVDKRFIAIEGQKRFWFWISPTVSAACSAFATFLLISYLQNIA